MSLRRLINVTSKIFTLSIRCCRKVFWWLLRQCWCIQSSLDNIYEPCWSETPEAKQIQISSCCWVSSIHSFCAPAVNLKIVDITPTTWRETISSGGISLLSEMIYSISFEKMSNSWRSAGIFSVATPSPSSASALPRWANKANLEGSIYTLKKTVNKCLVSGRLYHLTKRQYTDMWPFDSNWITYRSIKEIMMFLTLTLGCSCPQAFKKLLRVAKCISSGKTWMIHSIKYSWAIGSRHETTCSSTPGKTVVL